jgi:uncharacterized damage-inducible protein DinB
MLPCCCMNQVLNFAKYEYLLRVVNHGTYHRGQIVTMGRNIGTTDASNTDYNFYNIVKSSADK